MRSEQKYENAKYHLGKAVLLLLGHNFAKYKMKTLVGKGDEEKYASKRAVPACIERLHRIKALCIIVKYALQLVCS